MLIQTLSTIIDIDIIGKGRIVWNVKIRTFEKCVPGESLETLYFVLTFSGIQVTSSRLCSNLACVP